MATTHSLGRDGLGCLTTLKVDPPIYILQKQATGRTPPQAIQLTAQQIRDMAALLDKPAG